MVFIFINFLPFFLYPKSFHFQIIHFSSGDIS
uniref:Uncharacterized protein MANES_01G107600 n=1 Tax=Rhizophora mucronata TaxID=61149 RepID=A0A2P2NFV1_RHIMU